MQMATIETFNQMKTFNKIDDYVDDLEMGT